MPVLERDNAPAAPPPRLLCLQTPAGVVVAEGQHYNPYFAGGKIGMAKQLVDGQVDYPDGTVATESREFIGSGRARVAVPDVPSLPAPAEMAKDVAVFLAWASEPENDDRKRLGLKWMLVATAAVALSAYYKRFRWAPVKNRKITYTA